MKQLVLADGEKTRAQHSAQRALAEKELAVVKLAGKLRLALDANLIIQQ